MEQAAKTVNYDFSGVIKPANEKDHYSISYSDFVVPLVKGMQEQEQKIEKLERTIEELKNLIETLTINTSLSSDSRVDLNNKDSKGLKQNIPNPFTEKTTIDYEIPQTAGSAKIVFYKANGQFIKSVAITNKGKGQLNIFSTDFKNGAYSYSLIVDGKILDTKMMINNQ